MPGLRIVLPAVLVVVLLGSATANDEAPPNKELIVGVWEPAKPPEGLPPGSTMTVEFTKDGKFKTWVKFGDKPGPPHETLEGTYSIDGDKLTVVRKNGGKDTNKIVTITKLTDKELVAVEKEKDGTIVTAELKRKQTAEK